MGFISSYPYQDNLEAAANPLPSDDFNSGYSEGSKWLNTVTGDWFICSNSSAGSAVWLKMASSADSPASFEGFPLVDTFVGAVTGSSILLTNGASNGASVVTNSASQPNHPGVRILRTGNVSGVSRSQDRFTSGLAACIFSDGVSDFQIVCKPPARPTSASDSFELMIGYHAVTNAFLDTSRAVYLYYNFALFGDHNFRLRVVRTGTIYQQAITSFELPSVSQWQRFGISVLGGPFYSPSNRRVEISYGNEDAPVAFGLVHTVNESEWTSFGVADIFSPTLTYFPAYGIQKSADLLSSLDLHVDLIRYDKRFF